MPYNKVAATTNNPKRSASKPSVDLENKIKMDVTKNPKTKPKILFFVALVIKITPIMAKNGVGS